MTTIHTGSNGVRFDQISHQTIVKDGELMHLEIHNFEDQDGNKKQVAYNLLPALRKKMSEMGLGDFCFGPAPESGGNWRAREMLGVQYEDCDDPAILLMELETGSYRSLEAKQLLIDLLINKFNYHRWITTFAFDNYKPYTSLISDKDYKERMKLANKHNRLINTLNNDESVIVRQSIPIYKIKGGDKVGWYKTSWCTCKGFKNIHVDLYFAPDTLVSPYKNDKDSYHIVKNGNPIKTREHYCVIKGRPIIDENKIGEYDHLDIIVESIELA